MKDYYYEAKVRLILSLLQNLLLNLRLIVFWTTTDVQGCDGKKAKASHALGNDIISMKTLKKIGDRLTPYMVHLINSIIDTEIYPIIFKVSRISPTIKSGKPAPRLIVTALSITLPHLRNL